MNNDQTNGLILALVQKIEKLKKENEKYRKALEKIDLECSNHDTTAWSIANDALETKYD